MGFDDPCFARYRRRHDPHAARFAASVPAGHHAGAAGPRAFVRLNVSPDGEPFLPFAEGGFGTPDGKCHFDAETLDYAPPVESRHGDAELRAQVSAGDDLAEERRQHELHFRPPRHVDLQTSVLSIHPLDAELRGIVEGMPVEVFNGRGVCLLRAEFDEQLPRRVLRARSVRWNKLAPAGMGVNRLTSERLTDLGEGPTFYSCLVDVRPHVNGTFGTAR